MTNIHILMKNKDIDKNSYFIETGNYLLDGMYSCDDFLRLKDKINEGIVLYNEIKSFFLETGEGKFIYLKEGESENIYDILFDISRYPINQIRDEFLTSEFIYVISKIFKLHDMMFNNNNLFKIVEDMGDNEYSVNDFDFYSFSEDKYSVIKEIIPNFYNETDKYTGNEYQSDLLNISFIDDESENYEDREEFEFKHYRLKEF
jgi:hypothetical protein